MMMLDAIDSLSRSNILVWRNRIIPMAKLVHARETFWFGPRRSLSRINHVGETELIIECDYGRETENQLRMKRLIDADGYLDDNQCFVPNVFSELCTSQIMVPEYAPRATIDRIANVAPQDRRNCIGCLILYVTLQELFVGRICKPIQIGAFPIQCGYQIDAFD
jgi:predicted unusual protein kinase regulating ubiquinone biosynthesis (AarF/ABC1/UbiB family)